MLRVAPGELEADFQREYRIDLGDLWRGEMSPRRAAILAVNLPDGSAVWGAVKTMKAWSPATWFAHSTELHMRMNVWSKTKDGQDGKNQPEPWPTPVDEAVSDQKAMIAEEKARRFKERQQRRAAQQVNSE